MTFPAHTFRPLAASLIVLLGLSVAAPAQAESRVLFDTGWKEQSFPRRAANRYGFRGQSLTMTSDGAVSIAWRALDPSLWDARQADWDWRVSQGTPGTDLTRKGGDDRNIALYFVFMPEDKAQKAARAGLRRMLRNRDARVLVYVWGGDHRRQDMLASPYLEERGKTVVLRPHGTGAYRESVDLAADYQRAFGETPGAVVGVAVSGDSDDTDSRIEAQIDGLILR